MGLESLAKMLGIRRDLAEDALHSERAAKVVLSRRNLFAAAGAMAAGSLLVDVPQAMPLVLRGRHSDRTFEEPVALAALAYVTRCNFKGGVTRMDGALLTGSYIHQPTEVGPIRMSGEGNILMANFINCEQADNLIEGKVYRAWSG